MNDATLSAAQLVARDLRLACVHRNDPNSSGQIDRYGGSERAAKLLAAEFFPLHLPVNAEVTPLLVAAAKQGIELPSVGMREGFYSWLGGQEEIWQ